jgi:putative ABC transport system permease protein
MQQTMQPLFQDFRYAVRTLARTPGFTLVAVLTLALGIGANTAIFTVVNALLLEPLPYAAPERLVMVWQDFRARGGPADEWATPGNYVDWRNQKDLFEQVTVISGWRPALTGGSEPESLTGEQVSHEYFGVLGINPVQGRNFRPDDDVPNAPRVAIINEALWTRRFGAEPSVIGRTVMLSGEAHEIIGVMSSAFRPIVAADAEIWRPRQQNTATPSRGSITLRAVARLAPGLSLERAQAAATALAKQLEAVHPEYNEKVGFNLQPLHDRVVGDFKQGLLALLGAVTFVLLIACANIANLLLARGSARGRELGIRLALGAGRGRVIRQLLTESLMLASIGGAAGMLFGVWAVDALVGIAPENAPRLGEIRLDATVFAFTAALTLITGVLFGLAPAMQSSREDVAQSLKDGARGSVAVGGRLLRRGLIVAEVALALVLLTGGGLLLQTFVRLQSTDMGFNPDNILVGAVNPPRTAYDTRDKHRVFYDQMLEKISAIPGVERAAIASVLPLSGDSDTNFAIEGRPASRTPSETPITWYRLVSAGYFDTMGMHLRRGKFFAAGEAAPSVVVNETMATRYFPGEDPLGRRIRLGGAQTPWFTIIGVVGDARVRGARERTVVETFVPYWQLTEPGMIAILKARSDPTTLTNPLRQAIASVDRNVPVSGIGTLSDIVRESIGQPRFFALLAGAFAVLALVLAGIGIYGVMAYAVAQRTTEIGVRVALGATPVEVFKLIVGDGLKLTSIGVLLGVAGSMLVAKGLTTLLFGVTPWDPSTLAATAGILLTVAAAACFVPARRATRVDAMVALRSE